MTFEAAHHLQYPCILQSLLYEYSMSTYQLLYNVSFAIILPKV